MVHENRRNALLLLESPLEFTLENHGPSTMPGQSSAGSFLKIAFLCRKPSTATVSPRDSR